MGAGRSARTQPAATLPALLYQNDPIRQSVQGLGRKWVLLIVRDIAFLKLSKFGEFRRNNPGLSPRVLSRRLREMEREGLLVRQAIGREVRYRLTLRGEAAGLILLAFLQYGLKHQVGPQGAGLGAAMVPFTESINTIEPARTRTHSGTEGRPSKGRGRTSGPGLSSTAT